MSDRNLIEVDPGCGIGSSCRLTITVYCLNMFGDALRDP